MMAGSFESKVGTLPAVGSLCVGGTRDVCPGWMSVRFRYRFALRDGEKDDFI